MVKVLVLIAYYVSDVPSSKWLEGDCSPLLFIFVDLPEVFVSNVH